MHDIILKTPDVTPDAGPQPHPPTDLLVASEAAMRTTLAAVLAEGLDPTADDLNPAYRAASFAATRAEVAIEESIILRAYSELIAKAFADGDTFRLAYCVRNMRATVRACADRRAELRAAVGR